jgi:hypothetical protein
VEEALVRVGLVHFGGVVGDKVRVEAVRTVLRGNGVLQKELAFTHERHPVDMVREITRFAGLRHLTARSSWTASILS